MKRLACVIICTAGAALAMTGSASASKTDVYAALGDSYTAGPLVLPLGGPPLGCLRSAHNYPSLVRAAIGAAAFRDVSCAGATTTDMRSPQVVLGASNPPQFGALTSATTLVTIGIGGNDVGLVGAATTCVGLGVLAPTGTACRTKFTARDGGDLLNDRIAVAAQSIAAMLQAVHVRSPQARVLLVGYPAVAPRSGGCYPLVPLSDDDLSYLDEKLRATNAMLAAQAAANDAEYVDTYDDSVGHDVCTLPGTRWFEGLVPTNLAYPLHPNALGEASMARSVLRVLGRPRPGPLLGVIRRAQKAIPAGGVAHLRFTLSRAAGVTLTLQRSLGHGRYAPARTLRTVSARLGDNVVRLSATQFGRRAGLFRITASLAGGSSQSTNIRIRRPRPRRA
ncbi:MAG TPA: SGNH/GDSL hydrolase family protein [Solirubrobacteraceae bacterium]|nr:SGNH/GDSL hydrolase family protein [Solirubrobacteraceae bacterium]